jgi:hypothetical protein
MVLAKSKNAVGLGNSLMNDRFGRGKGECFFFFLPSEAELGENWLTIMNEGADRKKVNGIARLDKATGETVSFLLVNI